MVTVKLLPVVHKNRECILISFPNDRNINTAIRKMSGVKWSQTYRCWYTPLNRQSYEAIRAALGTAVKIESEALRTYLLQRQQTNVNNSQQSASIPLIPPSLLSPQKATNSLLRKDNMNSYGANGHVLAKMKEQLLLKAYSPSTIKTYLNEMAQLLQALKTIPAEDLQPAHLRRYLVYCYEKLKLTENTLHSRINALKFYYEQVLGRNKFFWEIPRPKKQLILPKVLGENELTRLFNALENKKHKAMLFTAYSAGLRVSEIVALKIKHVDSDRMQLLIKNAKGKKDRYVNLSPVLLDILRSYIKNYHPRPTLFLFESENTRDAYPTRTVQKIFQNAKEKAGISKDVGVHSLRHSFATHLLERGTDIKFIKDILGHFDIRTTERYLHVSKKALVNITSPLDDLLKKGQIDW